MKRWSLYPLPSILAWLSGGLCQQNTAQVTRCNSQCWNSLKQSATSEVTGMEDSLLEPSHHDPREEARGGQLSHSGGPSQLSSEPVTTPTTSQVGQPIQ